MTTEAHDDTAEELYEHAPCGYLSTALDGTILRLNETLLAWLGHTRDELVGTKHLADLMTPGSRLVYLTHHVPQLERAGTIPNVSVDLRRADGSVLPVFLSSVMTSGSADAARIIRSTIFDATERRAYESELVAAKEKAETAAHQLAVLHGIAEACARTTSAESVATAVATITRQSLNAVGAAVWLLDEADRSLRRAAAIDVIEELSPDTISLDSPGPVGQAWRQSTTTVYRRLAPEGWPDIIGPLVDRAGIDKVVAVPLKFENTVLGMLVLFLRRAEPLRDDELALFGTLGLQVGQTLERSRLHKELERKALHDGLTGLPNRTALHDRLLVALARAARTGDCVTVLLIDLNGFKNVNDRLGHAAGDLLLVDVARRLTASARPADTVARLGGDEFVVLCEHTDVYAAKVIEERLSEALTIDLPAGDDVLHVSASIGTVVQRGWEGPVDPDALLERADDAMYRAKRQR
jgi:diguanylate cyclase (GGDEF)-like protein/PAS domain S-box-containing protein